MMMYEIGFGIHHWSLDGTHSLGPILVDKARTTRTHVNYTQAAPIGLGLIIIVDVVVVDGRDRH